MVYARFSALIPDPIKGAFKQQLRYNKIDMDENKFVGFVIIYGFFLALGVAANISIFVKLSPLIVFPAAFLGFVSGTYLILKLGSESKGKFVESILPDALRLVASNMKSGLTTERALFVAGRPEFGPLQLELRDASKRIASGEKVDEALKSIGENINSNVLKKTIWLISQGIRSGGQIGDLLFQLSDDLKDQIALEEEIKSNVSIYILLILFAAILGAPVLFGISSFIVQVLTAQLALVPTGVNLGTSGGLGPISGFASADRGAGISSDFVVFFSLIALFFTTVFSSLTIGVINSGKELNGIKYVLPITIAGLVIFFAIREVLNLFFGNLV